MTQRQPLDKTVAVPWMLRDRAESTTTIKSRQEVIEGAMSLAIRRLIGIHIQQKDLDTKLRIFSLIDLDKTPAEATELRHEQQVVRDEITHAALYIKEFRSQYPESGVMVDDLTVSGIAAYVVDRVQNQPHLRDKGLQTLAPVELTYFEAIEQDWRLGGSIGLTVLDELHVPPAPTNQKVVAA